MPSRLRRDFAPLNLPFNFRELLVSVLADICTDYFGIPHRDGTKDYRIVQGGLDWTHEADRLGKCPGDFTSPSRYIFQPNPTKSVADIAAWQGNLLKMSLAAWVKDLRDDMKKNRNPTGAPVTLGMLSDPAYQNKADDLLGSAILGAMLGFLPTVEGCIKGAMLEWVESGRLWEVQNELGTSDDDDLFSRAMSRLMNPLIETIQMRPVPFMIWRTALEDCQLGEHEFKKNDKVVLCIESATQANRLLGKRDLTHMFGGVAREDASGSSGQFDDSKTTTHACPGYKAAMGIMLGIIATVLNYGSLRPTPSPLTFILNRKADD